MRYLTRTAASYVGVDLHARTLHLCVLDAGGGASCPAISPPGRGRSSTRSRTAAARACLRPILRCHALRAIAKAVDGETLFIDSRNLIRVRPMPRETRAATSFYHPSPLETQDTPNAPLGSGPDFAVVHDDQRSRSFTSVAVHSRSLASEGPIKGTPCPACSRIAWRWSRPGAAAPAAWRCIDATASATVARPRCFAANPSGTSRPPSGTGSLNGLVPGHAGKASQGLPALRSSPRRFHQCAGAVRSPSSRLPDTR